MQKRFEKIVNSSDRSVAIFGNVVSKLERANTNANLLIDECVEKRNALQEEINKLHNTVKNCNDVIKKNNNTIEQIKKITGGR